MAANGGQCVGLTLPPSCVHRLGIWETQPPGTLRARNRPLQGLLYLSVRITLNTDLCLATVSLHIHKLCY